MQVPFANIYTFAKNNNFNSAITLAISKYAMDLSDLRRDFGKNRKQAIGWPAQPFILFADWIQEAVRLKITEPNAMTLSTCGADRAPSARIVLLKEFSEDEGFVFYTHYGSRKGLALSENPLASLHFFWRETERQVSIEGTVYKVSPEKSDTYFSSRPRESRVSASLSPQSKTLSDPEILYKQWEILYNSRKEIRRPADWGGYRLVPERMEFWQGGEHRLHHRMVYQKRAGTWHKSRLAP